MECATTISQLISQPIQWLYKCHSYECHQAKTSTNILPVPLPLNPPLYPKIASVKALIRVSANTSSFIFYHKPYTPSSIVQYSKTRNLLKSKPTTIIFYAVLGSFIIKPNCMMDLNSTCPGVMVKTSCLARESDGGFLGIFYTYISNLNHKHKSKHSPSLANLCYSIYHNSFVRVR